MTEANIQKEEKPQERTIKSVINTPFKRVMLGVQILSYILIVGSPLIGGTIGGILKLTAAKTGAVIFGVFLAGEIFFYGSLAFLGKEIVLLIRDKVKLWFKRKKKQ